MAKKLQKILTLFTSIRLADYLQFVFLYSKMIIFMDKIKLTKDKISKTENSFKATIEGTDLSIEIDGDHIRAKPLMLIALGGCTALDVISLIKKMRIEIEGMTIDVDGEMSLQRPYLYTQFKVVYNFIIDGIPTIETKRKLLKIIEMSQEQYCGMSAMVRKIAPLSYYATINGHSIESCACKL